MAFINEYIPAEDKKKYNITEDSNFYLAGISSWTVDREREMFLMHRAGGGPESAEGELHWAFFWRGHLLSIHIKSLENGGDIPGGHGWTKKKVLGITGIDLTPETKAEILADLKLAFEGHGAFGMSNAFPPYATYDVSIEAE
jgi:hypothetical protein